MSDSLVKYIAQQFRSGEENFTSMEPSTAQSVSRNLGLDLKKATEWILDHPGDYATTLTVAHKLRVIKGGEFKSRQELERFVQKNNATVTYIGLQRASSQLTDLCERIQWASGGLRVFVAAFYTPPRHQGLDIHWDMGTVVAVQCEGAKKWELWRPVVSKSEELINLRPLTKAEKRQKPAKVVNLTQGALTIPRGWLHRAVAAGKTPSLHLSFGCVHRDMQHLSFAGD